MNARFAHKIALALGLTLLLGGCAFQLIYPRLPFLIGWQIDRYLDLDGAQEDWLDERLHQHLSDHRKNELPRYVEFTHKLQDTFKRDAVDEQTLLDLEEESRQLYQALMHSFLDDAVELLSGLSDEQVKQLNKKQAEEWRKADEEYQDTDTEERNEQRRENTIDDMSDLVGRLSKAQKQLIKTFVDQRADLYVAGKPTRERWQNLINDALQARQDKANLRAQLIILIDQPESLRDDDYAVQFQRNEQLRRQMYVALFATLNNQQRLHLQKELASWGDDFSALMKKN